MLHLVGVSTRLLAAWEPVLIASLKMDLFICMAVVACAGMYKDTAYVASMWTLRGLARETIGLDSAVNGSRLPSGKRHAHVFCPSQMSTKAAETWSEYVQFRGWGVLVMMASVWP